MPYNSKGQTFFGMTEKKASKAGYIAVGGEQFHAAAVAFIDGFKHSLRHNEKVIKNILERFYHYYPTYKPSQGLLTPEERMHQLINTSRMHDLIECMSYVFRQMAVDELLANPLNFEYREVYQQVHADMEPDKLREKETQLPPAILSALAHVLEIEIRLSYIEPNKEIPLKVSYGQQAATVVSAVIELQVQGLYYFPKVVSRKDFAYVAQLASKSSPAYRESVGSGKNLASLLEEIDADNQRILAAYDKYSKMLMSSVNAGELSKEDLIDLYVTHFPGGLSSSGNEAVFSAIKDGVNKTVIAELKASENQLCEAVVQGLARGLSLNKVDETALFEAIEAKGSGRKVPNSKGPQ